MDYFPSETDIRQEVVKTAGPCPFCGWTPSAGAVRKTRADDIDEEYYSIDCSGCDGWYEHARHAWVKPVEPGEEQEVVRV